MTRIKTLLVAVSSAVAFFSTHAHAISIAGVGSYNIPSMNSEPEAPATVKGEGAIGYGLLFGFGMAPMVSLELGGIMNTYQFDIGGGVTQTTQYLDIPVLVRMNLAKIVSLGVGAAYSLRMTSSELDPGGTITEDTDVKARISLVGSLAFDIPLAPTFSILIDGRYMMGLNDISQTSTGSEFLKFNSISILVGPQFKI